jgi:serine/threonine-protein kinase RsbW
MTEDIQLKLKSSPCQVKHVEELVKSLMCKCQLNQEVCDNILISLTEAVNNAIIHGNKEDIEKYVNIKCKESSTKVIIQISDEGNGFNPQGIKDPTLPENIECCGGRGVFIMKSLSDQLLFLDNGRTVELHFKTA